MEVNRDLLAYTNSAGKVVVGQKEYAIEGVALNFDWIDKNVLYVRTAQGMMVLNLDSGNWTYAPETSGYDFAPNPRIGSSGLLELGYTIWILETQTAIVIEAAMPDWFE